MRIWTAGLLLLGNVATGVAAVEVTIPPLPENAYQDPWLDARYDDDRDPLEGLNRAIFRFNFNFGDQYVVRPLTVGWMTVMPEFGRTGINNFLYNLEDPSSAVNHLLQLKFYDAGSSATRFVLNSTVGLLGFIDVADMAGLPRANEEFEEVLGHYGVGTGPYLMMPVYGPATPRSLVGDLVDDLVPPLSLLNFWQSAGKWALMGVEKRAELMPQEGVIFNALDPYAFGRSVYFEHVEWQVYDGQLPTSTVDPAVEDYLDEIDL